MGTEYSDWVKKLLEIDSEKYGFLARLEDELIDVNTKMNRLERFIQQNFGTGGNLDDEAYCILMVKQYFILKAYSEILSKRLTYLRHYYTGK